MALDPLFDESKMNYPNLGRLIETWTQNPGTIPKDTTTLRRDIESAAGCPLHSRITDIKVEPEETNTLIIKLPPKQVLQEGATAVATPTGGPYSLHPEYERQIKNLQTKLAPLEFFYFRVGEYTINQCK